MIRVSGLSLPLDAAGEAPLLLALDKLHAVRSQVIFWHVSKKSVDARLKSDVHFVYAVDVHLQGDERAVLKRLKPGVAALLPAQAPLPAAPGPEPGAKRPVVIGTGPSGLFAALSLARAGYRPIVLERGQSVDKRMGSVMALFDSGILDPESNIQFGEGGAGAYSDGKLTTGIRDPRCAQVLEILAAHGAPEEILYLTHPHIGTDKLPGVVASIRREILALGGEVHFGAKMTSIQAARNRLNAVTYTQNGTETTIAAEQMILAPGHSARDTLQMLYRAGLDMAQKPFSIGARIEHRQSMIDHDQYGGFSGHPALGAAEYHLSLKTRNGRGAYTFCMCPGGKVIAAASQPGGICVNGMSAYARSGENANSALLVDVMPDDFGDSHPLAGLILQRSLEQKAYQAGGGGFRAPVQRVEDFLAGRATVKLGDVTPTYRPGVTCTDLADILPGFAVSGMREAILGFSARLKGFSHPDAVLTGVETRSSSPVRIPRDAFFMANIAGIYPAGEGAGYAGGIMSAAVDGMAAAHALARTQGL